MYYLLNGLFKIYDLYCLPLFVVYPCLSRADPYNGCSSAVKDLDIPNQTCWAIFQTKHVELYTKPNMLDYIPNQTC